MERLLPHILRLTTQSKLQIYNFYSENNALKVKHIHAKTQIFYRTLRNIYNKFQEEKNTNFTNKYTDTVLKIFSRTGKVICLYVIKFQVIRLFIHSLGKHYIPNN